MTKVGGEIAVGLLPYDAGGAVAAARATRLDQAGVAPTSPPVLPAVEPRIPSQEGSTLVEIAIVLVIIGLLVGGILKGQEMITQARSKHIINEVHDLSAAYLAYLDRYRAIPGDDRLAGGPSGRWSGSVSGNGDGTIAGSYEAQPAGATPVASEESNLFWWHLRLAGFLAGPIAGAGVGAQPNSALGSMIGVQMGSGVATMGLSGLIICLVNIPDKIAIAVDAQTDDRAATTGSLHGALQSASNQAIAAATFPPTGGDYVETGANHYLLCRGL